MVPDQRKCVIDYLVVPKIFRTIRTVIVCAVIRHPINREGNPVVAGHIRVQTPVVLLLRDLGWVQGCVLGDIRDPVEADDVAAHERHPTNCTLHVTGEDIVGLNPHLNQQLTLSFMSSLTMAWLVRYDRHNRPVPELALAVPTRANGGVAANGPLREAMQKAAAEHGLGCFLPSRQMCTDNAAMIASAVPLPLIT